MKINISKVVSYSFFLFFLHFSQTTSINWRIVSVTSWKNIADSRANQRLILNGLKGHSKTLELNWKKGLFQHNKTDVFNATTKDIGPLQSITAWNDGTKKGPIWVVANITLTNLDDDITYITLSKNFYVNKSKLTFSVNHSTTTTNTITLPPPPTTTIEIRTSPAPKQTLGTTETDGTSVFSFTETAKSPTEGQKTDSTDETFISTIIYRGTSFDVTEMATSSDVSTDLTTNWTPDFNLTDIQKIPTTTTNNTTTTNATTVTTTKRIITTTRTVLSTESKMCVCPCVKNLTKEEKIQQLKEIKKELTIEKKNTSRYIRRKISVPDNRPSAKATGYIGIILLIIPFAAIIICDLSKVVTFCMTKYQSLKA